MESIISIKLDKIYKRYNGPWIIKDFSSRFAAPDKVAITGLNGAGKSTLLQMIIGFLTPTKGTVSYTLDDKDIANENIYKLMSFAAPYADLIEDFTVKETFAYYQRFKAFSKGFDIKDLLEISGLRQHQDKRVKYLSSGLNQRLKLIMAFATDTCFLVLDEPTSYLDVDSKSLYTRWFEMFCDKKLVIIASNDEYDLSGCNQRIVVGD